MVKAPETGKTATNKTEEDVGNLDDEVNFHAHGKNLKFASKSLFLLSPDNGFRKKVVWFITWHAFDNFILLLIFLNSIVLAMTDYGTVYTSGADKGELSPDSWRNDLVESSDPFFTIAFTIECLLKIIGMGLIFQKHSYLRDAWNWLDFVVVVAALLAAVPGIPKLSALRVIRVLRPLKSLNAVPGMKKMVASLLKSIPELMNVVAFLGFLFFIFGILGIQFWCGQLHSRCRMTEYPVALPAGETWPLSDSFVSQIKAASYSCYATGDCAALNAMYCRDEKGAVLKVDDNKWSHDSSPWNTARKCVWPIDADEPHRICSLTGSGGYGTCPSYGYMTSAIAGKESGGWCGSNYDENGNARFIGQKIMDGAIYYDDLMFGYLNFDNIAAGFLTIFQCITMEGWTDIMYQLQDSYSGIVTALYFTLLILFGSFFLLNLTLAVIWENFSDAKELEDLEKKAKAEVKRTEKNAQATARRLENLRQRQERQRARDEAAAAAGESSASVSSRQPAGDVLRSVRGHMRRFSTGRMSFDHDVDMSSVTTEQLIKAQHWDSPLRQQVHDLVVHPAFEGFIMICIFANTLALAMNKYPMAVSLNDNLEIVNFVLTVIFTLETMLKLVGLGLNLWKEDRFNLFDGFIVLVSWIEIAMATPAFLTGATSDPDAEGGALSALRTFRLFRVFKLARSWKSLQELLITISKTLDEIGNFSVLLGLFMYIYALVGMQFFAYKFRFNDAGYAVGRFEAGYEDSDHPRAHFDDLLWSLVTIFQILTGENWNTVMYDGWRATGWVSVFYFVSLVVLGSFIVLNLFLAILLGNFEGGDDEEEEETKNSSAASPGRKGSDGGNSSEEESAPVASSPTGKGGAAAVATSKQSGGCLAKLKSAVGMSAGNSRVAPVPTSGAAGADSKKAKANPDEPQPPGTTLFGRMGPEHPLRVTCFKLYKHPRFDNVILTLIVISSITLAIDNPLWSQDSTQVKVLEIIDICFSVAFTIEMSIKIVALGFAFHKGAYLRDSWNVLDFLLVGISWLSIASSGNSSLSALRSLRTFRALRPLRMISRNPGLKLVVNALFSSIPEIINVLMVCLLFFMIFAIVGVNYFKGRFMHCVVDEGFADGGGVLKMLTYPKQYTDWDAPNKALFNTYVAPSQFKVGTHSYADYIAGTTVDPPTSREICEALTPNVGAAWEANVPQNFDNAINGCLALFEMSTTEQWVDMMYAGVDATGIGMQPIRDHTPGMVGFFVAFMVVGAFFVMQLFVGVVIDNFNKMKDELGEGQKLFMTEAQSEWARMQKQVMKFRPIRPLKLPGALPPFFPKLLRVWCYHFVQKPWFDPCIMSCIVLNSVVMAMKYWGANDDYELALLVLNYLFGAIFTVECALKLLGLGYQYWHDSWNIFDFTIVFGTLLGVTLRYAAGIDVGSIATVMRTFRVGRIFRLVRSAPTLRKLFQTLIVTLPSLVNIGLLLALLFFIYAILGVQLYAKVRLQESLSPNGNFQSFWVAVLLLVRASTGENWNGLMYDCALTKTGDAATSCVSDPQFDKSVCGFSDAPGCTPINGCGDPVTPYVYWITFTLGVTFIMLNVFIAVILEGFSTEKENFEMKLNDDQIEAFRKQWYKYDPEGSGLMEFSKLSLFIQNLEPPMGFGDAEASRNELERRISELQSKGKGIRILAKSVGDGQLVRAVGFYDVANHLALRIVREVAKHKDEEWEEVDLQKLAAAADKRLNLAKLGGNKKLNSAVANKKNAVAAAADSSMQKEDTKIDLMAYDMGHCYAALSVYSAYRNHALCDKIHQKIADRQRNAKAKVAGGSGDGQDSISTLPRDESSS